MDEKDVIKRCQNGDKSAFDQLIRYFYPYVSKFLIKLTGSESLSEDLTQETFLKIIRSIENYNLHSGASFGTYIITIAKNTYIDYLRKNKISSIDIENLNIDDNDNFENKLIDRFEYEQIIKYLDSLPPNQS